MPGDEAAVEHIEPDEAERLALEAAVAEARASGPGIPHEVMRKRMLKMIAEARAKTDDMVARGRAAEAASE